MVDTGIAFSHNSEGPDSTLHDKSRPDLFWLVTGATVLGADYRCRSVGLVSANFHNVGTPFGPYGIDMHGIRQSPSLYGGTIVRGTAAGRTEPPDPPSPVARALTLHARSPS